MRQRRQLKVSKLISTQRTNRAHEKKSLLLASADGGDTELIGTDEVARLEEGIRGLDI